MALLRLNRLNHRALTNPPPLTHLFSSSSEPTTTDVKVSSGKESERVVKMEESEARPRLGNSLYKDLRQSLMKLKVGDEMNWWDDEKDDTTKQKMKMGQQQTRDDSMMKKPTKKEGLEKLKSRVRDESEAPIKKNDVDKEGLPREDLKQGLLSLGIPRESRKMKEELQEEKQQQQEKKKEESEAQSRLWKSMYEELRQGLKELELRMNLRELELKKKKKEEEEDKKDTAKQEMEMGQQTRDSVMKKPTKKECLVEKKKKNMPSAAEKLKSEVRDESEGWGAFIAEYNELTGGCYDDTNLPFFEDFETEDEDTLDSNEDE